jgi:hypothetical protein
MDKNKIEEVELLIDKGLLCSALQSVIKFDATLLP